MLALEKEDEFVKVSGKELTLWSYAFFPQTTFEIQDNWLKLVFKLSVAGNENGYVYLNSVSEK